jgi:hypothetical protein
MSEALASIIDRVLDPSWTITEAFTTPHPHTTTLLSHGLNFPEFLYEVDDTGTRFDRTGVPPLLCTTLPHLLRTGGPRADALYDVVSSALTRFEGSTLAAGYDSFWCWLADDRGKRFWVERSGSSAMWVQRLVEAFPGAKFIHLYRDGWATALSMQRHHAFRFELLARKLKAHLGRDPFVDGEPVDVDAVPVALRGLLPETISHNAFRSFDWPIREFSLWWSALVASAVRWLSTLPAEQVLHVQYERLVLDPTGEFARIAEFVGGAAPGRWADRAAAMVTAGHAAVPTAKEPRQAAKWLEPGRRALQAVEG